MKPGHVDPARADDVDAVLVLEPGDLRRREPEQREHPALRRDRRTSRRGCERASSAVDERAPVGLDPVAHRGQLGLPLRRAGPRRRGSCGRCRRRGPAGWSSSTRIATLTWLWTARGVGRRRGDDHDRARPAPRTARTSSRTRSRPAARRPGRTSSSRPGGVLAQPVAEALVGEVDERQQPALLDQVADPPPQGGRRVHAGRVVAGAVEQHDVARDAPARAPPASPPRRSGARSRPCTGRSGPGSRRRGTAAGGSATSARSSTASGPSPSGGAGPRRPAGRRCRRASGSRARARRSTASWSAPSDEGAHELAVGDLAVDRAVELGPGGVGEPALGLDDRRQDRRRAGLVHEHARGQVDLAGRAGRSGRPRPGRGSGRAGRGCGRATAATRADLERSGGGAPTSLSA